MTINYHTAHIHPGSWIRIKFYNDYCRVLVQYIDSSIIQGPCLIEIDPNNIEDAKFFPLYKVKTSIIFFWDEIESLEIL